VPRPGPRPAGQPPTAPGGGRGRLAAALNRLRTLEIKQNS